MPNLYYSIPLLASLLWGGNFVVGKFLVGHASPLTLTSLRWLIAVLFLFPILWWKERKLLPPKEAIFPLFLMGLTGVVLFNIFQFLALERSSATNIGLISALNLVSISVFSFLFLREKINFLQIVSVLISLVGVTIFISKGNVHFLLSMSFSTGDAFMMVAVGMWGIFSVCSKWAMQKTSPMMSTLYSGIFGLILLLPFNIANFTVTKINGSFIESILYTGILSTVVSLVLWNLSIQKIGATASGVFLNFNPIFTAILAFLLLGERITWIQGIGGGIVIIGSYLFSRFKAQPVRQTFHSSTVTS